MKGTIYLIHNKNNNYCYIGSTCQENPKRRYSRHKCDCLKGAKRYEPLFSCGDPDFHILSQEEYQDNKTLKNKENYYIHLYRGTPGVRCINKNMAWIPPELQKEARKASKRKYHATEKGIEARKWQNYRCYTRKKLLKELKERNAKSLGQKETWEETKGMDQPDPANTTN